MHIQNDELLKLKEVLRIIKMEGYLTGEDWEVFGKQMTAYFEKFSPYQRQVLLHSLKLIINSRDQISNTRQILHRMDHYIRSFDKNEYL